MSVTAGDIRTLLTSATGPGSSTTQANTAQSIGGFASQTPWYGGTANDLFSAVSANDQTNLTPTYRCIYIYNANVSSTAPDVRVFLAEQFAGGSTITIGVDTTPTSLLTTAGQQAVRTANEYAAPAGVVFSAPTGYYSDAIMLGDLPAGYGRAIWIKRIPDSADGLAVDECDIIIEVSY